MRAGAVLAVLAGGASLLGLHPAVAQPAVIEVTGTAIVAVAPDLATVSFSLTSAGETPAAATARSEQSVVELMAFLETMGIPEKDVRIDPVQLVPDRRPALPADPNAARAPDMDRFSAITRFRVRFKDLDKASRFSAAARAQGGMLLGLTTYSVVDPGPGADAARQAAFAAARLKAEGLAQMAGLKLGRLVRITIPSRESLAKGAEVSQPVDGIESGDVVRVVQDLPKGVKPTEVRAVINVAWEAE